MTPKFSISSLSVGYEGKKRRGQPRRRTRGRSQSLSTGKQVTCLYCDKVWPTFSQLEMHMNKHTEERPYQCNNCDANFSFSSALYIHQNNVHLNRYTCKICNKSFLTPTNLSSHKRLHITEINLRSLADRGFKSAMKKTITKRTNSDDRGSAKSSVSCNTRKSSQLDTSNNILSERQATTRKGIRKPITSIMSCRTKQRNGRRRGCKSEKEEMNIFPTNPPSSIVQTGAQASDLNSVPTTFSLTSIKGKELLALVQKKIVVIKLTKIDWSKTGVDKTITTSTKSVQEGEENEDVDVEIIEDVDQEIIEDVEVEIIEDVDVESIEDVDVKIIEHVENDYKILAGREGEEVEVGVEDKQKKITEMEDVEIANGGVAEEDIIIEDEKEIVEVEDKKKIVDVQDKKEIVEVEDKKEIVEVEDEKEVSVEVPKEENINGEVFKEKQSEVEVQEEKVFNDEVKKEMDEEIVVEALEEKIFKGEVKKEGDEETCEVSVDKNEIMKVLKDTEIVEEAETLQNISEVKVNDQKTAEGEEVEKNIVTVEVEEEEMNSRIEGENKISEDILDKEKIIKKCEEDVHRRVDLEVSGEIRSEETDNEEVEERKEINKIVEDKKEIKLKVKGVNLMNDNEVSVIEDDLAVCEKNETISSKNTKTVPQVSLSDVTIRLDNFQGIESKEKPQQSCNANNVSQQKKASRPDQCVSKEKTYPTRFQISQASSNLVSENQALSQVPCKSAQFKNPQSQFQPPMSHSQQQASYQFPAVFNIPLLSYTDKTTIPVVVEVDPVTGRQTPFPSPFNPAVTNPSSSNYVQHPNLFFSVNGKLVMPLFSVDMFRYLGPLPPSSFPTPTIVMSDADEESCDDDFEDEVDGEDQMEQVTPQPSTPKQCSPSGKASTKRKLKRNRMDSDQSWSYAANKRKRKSESQGAERYGAHKCHSCSRTFDYRCHLTRHIISTHSEIKPFPCDFCELGYRQKPQLLDHIITKHCQTNDGNRRNVRLYCPFCERNGNKPVYYKEKKDMHVHLQKQHLKSIQTSSVYEEILKVLPSKKSEKLTPMKKSSKSKVSVTVKTSSKVLQREKKRKFTQMKKSATATTTAISKNTKSTFSRNLPKTAIATNTATSDEKILLSCSFCDKVFHQQYHLTNHLRQHTGGKPHVCLICSSRFTRKDSLIQHFVHVHTQIKRLSGTDRKNGASIKRMDILCPICETAHLASREELMRHIHVDHSEALMPVAE